MYEFVFKDLGFRLPFTSFQMALFTDLTLAPSQLHQNAFAFMRAFEIVCEYLRIGATVPLFMRCFRVQRQSREGRFNWVSFKNVDHRLFKMYTDSVKYFKDKYYLIRPKSLSTSTLVLRWVPVTDEEGRTIVEEDGGIKTKLTSAFPFKWWQGHFLNDAWDYSYTDDELDEQDLAAHAKLYWYIEKFSAAQWVTRTGEPIVDEKGDGVREARSIDTKSLLSCRTAREAHILLGCMMVYQCFYCRLCLPYANYFSFCR